jgi:hypothetical protein
MKTNEECDQKQSCPQDHRQYDKRHTQCPNWNISAAITIAANEIQNIEFSFLFVVGSEKKPQCLMAKGL